MVNVCKRCRIMTTLRVRARLVSGTLLRFTWYTNKIPPGTEINAWNGKPYPLHAARWAQVHGVWKIRIWTSRYATSFREPMFGSMANQHVSRQVDEDYSPTGRVVSSCAVVAANLHCRLLTSERSFWAARGSSRSLLRGAEPRCNQKMFTAKIYITSFHIYLEDPSAKQIV